MFKLTSIEERNLVTLLNTLAPGTDKYAIIAGNTTNVYIEEIAHSELFPKYKRDMYKVASVDNLEYNSSILGKEKELFLVIDGVRPAIKIRLSDSKTLCRIYNEVSIDIIEKLLRI